MAKLEKQKKLKYGDRDYLVSIKTKSGKEIGGPFFEWLLPRWAVVPISVTVLVLVLNVTHLVMTNNRLSVENKTLVSQIKKDKATLASEKKKAKPSVIYKDVVVQTHTATEAGDALAQSMTLITKKQANKQSDDIKDTDVVEAANVVHKLLEKTPDDWNKIQSWLKQGDWTLEFRSKAAFEGTKTDVLFELKDASGKLVGYVTAVYDVIENQFRDVRVVYLEGNVHE